MSANTDMVQLWNGDATSAWVQAAQRYDDMLEPLGAAALRAAALRPGDRVLDVGCGSGAMTRAAASAVAPDGRVLGVDVSEPLLVLARQHAAPDAVEYRLADAQTEDLGEAAFDVVVSRFGVMFFGDPVEAFANLAWSTAEGGRLSVVCWQPLLSNPWALTAVVAVAEHVPLPAPPPPGTPGPFAFGDADRVTDVLTQGGWCDVRVDALTTDVQVYGARTAEEATRAYAEDAFGRTLLGDAEPPARERALQALTEALRPHEQDGGVRLGAAVWLVTAQR